MCHCVILTTLSNIAFNFKESLISMHKSTVEGIEEQELQSEMAVRLSTSLFQEMLSASAEGLKILNYSKLLHEKDPSFTYHVACGNEGLPTGLFG